QRRANDHKTITARLRGGAIAGQTRVGGAWSRQPPATERSILRHEGALPLAPRGARAPRLAAVRHREIRETCERKAPCPSTTRTPIAATPPPCAAASPARPWPSPAARSSPPACSPPAAP